MRPVIRRALLSVADKTGLVEFARELCARGVALVASGKTAHVLRDAGLAVAEVADLTHAPEILGGRVKTLHPTIHGGILAQHDNPAHHADLHAQGIAPFELVVVNLYPFAKTIAAPECTQEHAIEQIDIGGPALLRAAAKNFASVVALCDPEDYAACLRDLDAHELCASDAFARTAATKIFAMISAYDSAIHNFFTTQVQGESWPATRSLSLTQTGTLRYGENPHQSAGWYAASDALPWMHPPLQGKALSYNNLLDLDAAVRLAADLRAYPHAVAIIKHTTPCGVGVSEESLDIAYTRALAADPLSAFGGIVACTTPLDAATATLLTQTFFEVIAAPAIDAAAVPILAAKKNLRVLTYDWPPAAPLLRSACGGMLVQAPDRVAETRAEWTVASARAPTEAEWQALELAWRICAHVRSNAIVCVGREASVGIGAGQMSRVDAVHMARYKMGDHAALAAASDAFFPFRDGLDALAAAGVTAVVQPGGSLRDAEVIAAANEHGLAMAFTALRHFRH